MSRLWDTPEYWVRYEADEVLTEMPDADPATLAELLERGAANYDDAALAELIVAELRRRAAAGIRFWPGPPPIGAAGADGQAVPDNTAELVDDDIPW